MKQISRTLLALTVCAFFAAWITGGLSAQQSGTNGVGMSMGSLSHLSHAKTRSISPENITGEKGKGGMATEGTGAKAARDLGQGWKISPSVRIKAGQTFVMADVVGQGAMQHIWMTPTGHWRYSLLRIYWDGETTPSVEVPVGDPLQDDIASTAFWYQTEPHASFPKLPPKDDLEVK